MRGIGVLLTFGLVASCQTATKTEASRTGKKTIVFELTDPALLPDRAFATFVGGGEKAVEIGPMTGTNMSFTVDLDKVLGADEKMMLNLSSYGMVTTIVACVVNSNGDLEKVGAIVRDTMARSIARRLDGEAYPKSGDGAIQAYADALIENQPLFQPYPQEFPKGLDTAKVRIEALHRAAKSGMPLEQLASDWGLALSYQNARNQILSLVPPISTADSAVLFPPPHVRVEQALSSSDDLGAGGNAVGLVGSIASDVALASIEIDVLDAKGVLASEEFAIRYSQPKSSLLWDLAKDGQVTIKAVNATPGIYTVQIVGRDIQGRSAVLTLEITVRAAGATDDQGPVVGLVSPVADSTVEHTVATYDVVVSATDPAGVDSVVIGGNVATRNPDGNWHRVVALDTTGAATVVEIVAFDSLGNVSRQTVRVTRKRPPGFVVPEDRTAPVAVLLAGLQKNITIDDPAASKKIGWTVSDDRKLGTVRINQIVVSGSNGEYSTTLSNLPMGETKVFLEASDSAGNVALDTVVVTRVEAASPVLTFSHPEGTHDSVLHVSITSSVSDAVLKYTVDGTDPSPTSGLTYSLGGTILISQSRTLKVMATATGHNPTAILSRVYTLKADPPTFSVASGTTADSMFTVKLSSPTAGVTYYYTTDGSAPIAGVSPSTTTGILVDSIRTLKVIASKTGWSASDAITGKFNANIPLMLYVGQGGTKVVRADGSLWTTGAAASLADGSVVDRATFEKVLEGVRAVDNGLILTTTGDVLSYGGRYGSTSTSMNPIASGMVKISGGAEPSAMLLDSRGGLYALGQNDAGQLCTGDLVEVQTPKLVASGVKDVGVGCMSAKGSPYCRSFYVTNSGTAYGCGQTIGVAQNDPSLPTQIPGSGYISTAAWADFFQGGYPQQNTLLKSTGELMQLISTSSGRVWTSVRTDVVKAIPAGRSLFSLETYGWLYHLGDGGSPATDWTLVSNHITDMATDGATNLYIKMDGTLWASGYNGGRYGDGTTEDAAAMKRVRLPN